MLTYGVCAASLVVSAEKRSARSSTKSSRLISCLKVKQHAAGCPRSSKRFVGPARCTVSSCPSSDSVSARRVSARSARRCSESRCLRVPSTARSTGCIQGCTPSGDSPRSTAAR
eukprot:scaffold581_cov83-Phaeocystis_antarctica.AAC.6